MQGKARSGVVIALSTWIRKYGDVQPCVRRVSLTGCTGWTRFRISDFGFRISDSAIRSPQCITSRLSCYSVKEYVGGHFRCMKVQSPSSVMNLVHPATTQTLLSSRICGRETSFDRWTWPASFLLWWHGHLAHDRSRAGRPCHEEFSAHSTLRAQRRQRNHELQRFGNA